MLNVSQLSEKIADVAHGRLALEQFESWFRRDSRNVHAWGSKHLLAAVFAVEGVFSQYYFDGLDEDSAKQELANAIRPFEKTEKVLKVSVSASNAPLPKEDRTPDPASYGALAGASASRYIPRKPASSSDPSSFMSSISQLQDAGRV